MSYNIAHGRGSVTGPETLIKNFRRKSPMPHLMKISQLISNYDIVWLSEVDFNHNWSQSINQAEVLAKTGSWPYLVKQINYDIDFNLFKACWGNCLLSKYPVVSAKLVDLPAKREICSLWGKKNGLYVVLDVDGKQLRILALHLYDDQTTRQESWKYLHEFVQENSVDILLGDLNQSKPEIDKFISYTPSYPPSFPSEGKAIDHICVNRESGILVQECQTLNQYHYSDHHPVTGRISFSSTNSLCFD